MHLLPGMASLLSLLSTAVCQSSASAAAARSLLNLFASRITLIFSAKEEFFIFSSNFFRYSDGTWTSFGLCPEISTQWKDGCGPPHPQQGPLFLFWPLLVPSFCVVSVPARFRGVDLA